MVWVGGKIIALSRMASSAGMVISQSALYYLLIVLFSIWMGRVQMGLVVFVVLGYNAMTSNPCLVQKCFLD